MTNEEIFGVTVLNSWRLVINRFNKTLSELSDEQLQQQVAPGRNRVFYLLGHLTAMHDRMFPLLGIGERLHTELDEPYIAKSGPRACRSTLGNRTYESMGRG